MAARGEGDRRDAPAWGADQLATGSADSRSRARDGGRAPASDEIVVRHVPSSGWGASSVLPWIVFVLGLVMIAIAWTLSLRARPLALRRGRVSAT